MKVTGIVCEYNPMHNGHLHHITQTRLNGATHIIAVMSGNFVQRGETAVMDKFRRGSLALKGGADLVIEIPSVYCLSSAEFYARGAVSIMNALGCVDEISFGSESGDMGLLCEIAKAAESIPRETLRAAMEKGMTYPAALSAAIAERYGEDNAAAASSPNNILAIEYLKALDFLGSDIKPFTVSRHGAGHDSDSTSGEFASASYIRECMAEQKDFGGFIPDYVRQEYEKCRLDGKISRMENLERIILYKLRTAPLSELKNLPDVGQGLEYRLKQSAEAGSVGELLESVKTKRYTMARLKRILLNMLIGTTKEDLQTLPPYARILAMNERGREILGLCKNSSIPVSTSLSKLAQTGKAAGRFAFIEGTASDVYGLSQNVAGSKSDDFRSAVRIEKNGY